MKLSDEFLPNLQTLFRLFDDTGEGFITVTRFRVILKEIDEDFTEDELDEIISEVNEGQYMRSMI